MDNKALEAYYENNILPKYAGLISFKQITWKDHGQIDLDAWGHYFEDADGHEYVLLWEDFPGSSYLDDDATHDVVMIDGESSLHYPDKEGHSTVNLYGYFTLYKEIPAH
jgi:hypothetical protein